MGKQPSHMALTPIVSTTSPRLLIEGGDPWLYKLLSFPRMPIELGHFYN